MTARSWFAARMVDQETQGAMLPAQTERCSYRSPLEAECGGYTDAHLGRAPLQLFNGGESGQLIR